MATQRLQVNFNDSSDDGNSHLAALDVVPDGDPANGPAGSSSTANNNNDSMRGHARDDASASGRASSSRRDQRGGEGGGGGWFGHLIMRGVNGLIGGGELTHEPFPADQESGAGQPLRSSEWLSSTRSPRANWGYGVLDHDNRSDSTRTSSSSNDSTSDNSSDAQARGGMQQSEENYQINLRESVLQYLRTPEELYINIILATLKTGTTQVNADVFRVAAGCPLLIKTFLESGYSDLNDPEVHAILQSELDMVLSGDPYANDILREDQAAYLHCLCDVKSLRINQRQMVLMRYSGFEFIKMLFDYPHLRENIKTKQMWVYPFFRVMHMVNLVASWMGVSISLLFTATVIWAAMNWFETVSQKNNGYWTVICYGLGYVIMLVAVLRTEQVKIKQYDSQRWAFPNNNLVIIPAIPVYQIMLVVTALRYELVPDKARFFIIRCDLRNAIEIHLVAHGICHAIPQMIVQIFLFTERAGAPPTKTSTICFWLLVGSACASFFMAVFAYARMVIFSHSCDAFGFAVMFVDSDEPDILLKQRIKPTDIATRFLIFFTMSLIVAAAVTLFIFLLNISNCDASAKVFLSVFFGVVGLTVISMSIVFVYANFSRCFGLFSIPVVLCTIAYFPYTQVNSQADNPLPITQLCALLVYHFSSCSVPLFAVFGAVCVSFLSWLGMVLYEVIKGERIQQRVVDNYMPL